MFSVKKTVFLVMSLSVYSQQLLQAAGTAMHARGEEKRECDNIDHIIALFEAGSRTETAEKFIPNCLSILIKHCTFDELNKLADTCNIICSYPSTCGVSAKKTNTNRLIEALFKHLGKQEFRDFTTHLSDYIKNYNELRQGACRPDSPVAILMSLKNASLENDQEDNDDSDYVPSDDDADSTDSDTGSDYITGDDDSDYRDHTSQKKHSLKAKKAMLGEFACPECGMRFTQATNRDTHVHNQHEGTRYYCTVLGCKGKHNGRRKETGWKSKSGLRNHMITRHPKIWKKEQTQKIK